MKIGIMQPYFFPYIGYFSLIKNTDKFILFDTVQFIRHGWIERNRILNPTENWHYIHVPIKKHSQTTAIKDIKINNTENWREKILAQLAHYKKKAPFYNEVITLINKSINIETESIAELNFSTLKATCDYLEISFDYKIFSKMNLIIDKPNAPDEWALNICKALGNVDEYWNPEGGLEFFDKSKYEKEGIDIKFIKHNLPYYSQKREPKNFENGLSIIDVMMFNSPEKTKEMIDDYTII